MRSFRVQEAAAYRLEEIHRRTRDRWEADQADAYVAGMFEAFAKIAAGRSRRAPSRPSPASKDTFPVMESISSTGKR